MLPAILAVVGPRGWIKPRRELAAPLWRRSGVRIVRRPWPHLAASVLVLILLASAFFMIRAIGSPRLLSVGTAATLLVCAMATVAAGALLPTIEDWFAARHEDRLIEPILQELLSRQPDIGIGVRPRGPLVFRIAENTKRYRLRQT